MLSVLQIGIVLLIIFGVGRLTWRTRRVEDDWVTRYERQRVRDEARDR
jgi:hypothetical protein